MEQRAKPVVGPRTFVCYKCHEVNEYVPSPPKIYFGGSKSASQPRPPTKPVRPCAFCQALNELST